jgi:hypothetical protein
MTSFDFEMLRVQIRDAARHTFGTLRAAHPNERFYAMALYTDDGAMTRLFNASCWTANSPTPPMSHMPAGALRSGPTKPCTRSGSTHRASV